MALSTPTHRIHTIHGAFGNSFGFNQASAKPLVLSAAQASAFTHLPNVSLPPRGRGSGSGSGSRTAPATSTASSSISQLQPWQTSTRQRRPLVIPTSSRRAPPPPPRTVVVTIEDPFADNASPSSKFFDDEIEYSEPESLPSLVSPSPRNMLSRTRPSTLTYSGGAALQPLPPHIYADTQVDRERARGRLVASVLLSRACGRPMRGRSTRPGEPRDYVRSGLSRVVEVECMA